MLVRLQSGGCSAAGSLTDSFPLQGVFTANNYALTRCYMPEETTVIYVYILVVIGSVLLVICNPRLKSLHSDFYRKMMVMI